MPSADINFKDLRSLPLRPLRTTISPSPPSFPYAVRGHKRWHFQLACKLKGGFYLFILLQSRGREGSDLNMKLFKNVRQRRQGTHCNAGDFANLRKNLVLTKPTICTVHSARGPGGLSGMSDCCRTARRALLFVCHYAMLASSVQSIKVRATSSFDRGAVPRVLRHIPRVLRHTGLRHQRYPAYTLSHLA